jgi:hypothetical protein
MRNRIGLALACVLAICATAAVDAADKHLVSGDLRRLNNFVKIAVNPANGNALVVWAQGNANNNDYGRVYASELTRQQDGSYAVGPYFMVSPNSGSHNRPSVAWLPNAGKYIIAWDTSFYDLNEYWDLNPFGGRPFPAEEIYSMTYTHGLNAAGLGEQVQISDSTIELNLVACVIALGAPPTAPATGVDRVFISYLASDESEYPIMPILDITSGKLTATGFEAGLWGSKWDVSANPVTADAKPTSAPDISMVDRKQMLDWGVSVIASGFQSGNLLYCAAIYVSFNRASGVGMILQINPETMKVVEHVDTGEYDFHGQDIPTNAFGSVVPLDIAQASPSDGIFTLVGTSNLMPQLLSVNSDLDETSAKHLGLISKTGDAVDQHLFKASATMGAPAKKSDVYVLYYNKLGQFRYRSLAAGTGKPTGTTTTILKINKRRLKYMDVATYGKDVLVAFAEQSNKKNYKINFFKFTVQ